MTWWLRTLHLQSRWQRRQQNRRQGRQLRLVQTLRRHCCRRLRLMPRVKAAAQLRHGLEPDGGDPELLSQLLQLLLEHGTLSACS